MLGEIMIRLLKRNINKIKRIAPGFVSKSLRESRARRLFSYFDLRRGGTIACVGLPCELEGYLTERLPPKLRGCTLKFYDKPSDVLRIRSLAAVIYSSEFFTLKNVKPVSNMKRNLDVGVFELSPCIDLPAVGRSSYSSDYISGCLYWSTYSVEIEASIAAQKSVRFADYMGAIAQGQYSGAVSAAEAACQLSSNGDFSLTAGLPFADVDSFRAAFHKIGGLDSVEPYVLILTGEEFQENKNTLAREATPGIFEKMLKAAKLLHPQSRIVVLHTRDTAGARRFESIRCQKKGNILHAAGLPVAALLPNAIEVLTDDNAAGFEACIAGRSNVSVYEETYFTGWGFTNDNFESKARAFNASPAEVLCATAILTVDHVDLVSRQIGSFSSYLSLFQALRSSDVAENAKLRTHLNRTPSLQGWRHRVAALLEISRIDDVTLMLKAMAMGLSSLKSSWRNRVHRDLMGVLFHTGHFDEVLEIASAYPNPERNFDVLSWYLYSLYSVRDFDRLELVAEQCLQAIFAKFEQDNTNLGDFRRLINLLYLYRTISLPISKFGRLIIGKNMAERLVKIVLRVVNSNKYHMQTIQIVNEFIILLGRIDFEIGSEFFNDILSSLKYDHQHLVNVSRLLVENEIITAENMTGRTESALEAMRVAVAENTSSSVISVKLDASISVGKLGLLLEILSVGTRHGVLRFKGFDDLYSRTLNYLTSRFGGEDLSSDELGFVQKVRLLEKLDSMAKDDFHGTGEVVGALLGNIVRQAHRERPSDIGLAARYVQVLRDSNGFNELETVYQRYKSGDFPQAPQILQKLSSYRLSQNDYDEALSFMERACATLANGLLLGRIPIRKLAQLHNFQEELGRKRFYASSSELMRSVPQPAKPKGVVFVLGYDALNVLAMGIPVLCDLRRQGYATVYLGSQILPNEPTGIEEIDQFLGIVHLDHMTIDDETAYNRQTKNQWEVDWDNKRLICNGVNYYQGVFEYLANRYRRFSIDIEQPHIRRFFDTQLMKCDRAVTICERIQKDVASKLGLPVRFMAVSAQTSPSYVFKEYCAEVGWQDDMHLLFHINGYENYFSNLGTKVSSTMAVGDMTARPFIRSPLIVQSQRLDAWCAENIVDATPPSYMLADRVGNVGLSRDAVEVYERVVRHKAAGGKVVVCFGKVLCDLGVPYDGGPAHKDIIDWLNHTVECARNSDTMVLIKPHPHELRPEISRHLTEYLFDVVHEEIPDNVILLQHNWFNNQNIQDLVDVAILWNGTSCLEMSVWGVPVVNCAYFGEHDYPVDLIYPKDRDHYKTIIQHPEQLSQGPNTRQRAAACLEYISDQQIYFPYRFCPRPATNDPVGDYHWIEEDIARWKAGEDPFVSLFAAQYFEPLTPGEDGVATPSEYEAYRVFKHALM